MTTKDYQEATQKLNDFILDSRIRRLENKLETKSIFKSIGYTILEATKAFRNLGRAMAKLPTK